MGVRRGLEVFSPVTEDGRYSDAVLPSTLAGLSVTDPEQAQRAVVAELLQRGRVLLPVKVTQAQPPSQPTAKGKPQKKKHPKEKTASTQQHQPHQHHQEAKEEQRAPPGVESLLPQMTHPYPHCWRCKKGLISRATEQWFCSLSHNDVVAKTLAEAKENVTFVPPESAYRFYSAMGNRVEWCISRQRTLSLRAFLSCMYNV